MKEQNIKPIPKWRFTLNRFLIGLAIIISIGIGGLAFSIILFSIQQLGFDLITHMTHSTVEFLLGLLPFIWIILLIIFLVLGMVRIKNSRKGYKLSPARLLAYNTSFSILFGVLFFISGGAQWFEHVFDVNVSSYESVREKKVNMWSMPEKGYLSGTIESITDNSLILRDFSNKRWVIDFKDAKIPAVLDMEEGSEIKLFGQMISKTEFKASELKPWGGNQRFYNGRNGNKKNKD